MIASACALFASLAVSASSADGWGYGYDSLLADLAAWRLDRHARVDSIGASARGRGLWMVTVTDSSDSVASVEGRSGRKRRIVAHARTHPWEVQAFHVARGMIRFLLGPSEEARAVRRDFVVSVLPQYNPDGVELGLERTNANGVDLESAWDAASPQPEVAALRGLFRGLMAGPLPVDVALNLHSDQYNGKRFFVYHLEAGTSWVYAEEEKRFVAAVQAHAPGAIQPWDFLTSWAGGTATRYPEGWWWTNHGASVMALTYEDDNSATACCFDSVGRALVLGSVDHLRGSGSGVELAARRGARLALASAGVTFRADGPTPWEVRDMAGKVVARGVAPAGTSTTPWAVLGRGGVRILVARFPDGLERRSLPAILR